MAAPFEESKIMRQFFPSLFHIASVNVALSLKKDFDHTVLTNAFNEIQHENSEVSTEDSEESQTTDNRAKRNWRFIPRHLRKRVWEVLIGLQISCSGFFCKNLDVEMNQAVYVRSEGTIDSIKSAQHVVLNKNINIRKRFEVACNYCFQESIQVLWSEMEVSGEIGNLETTEFSMARFWSNRMRYGSEVPWTQAVNEYIESLGSPPVPRPRFSAFFPLLQPKDRRQCLIYLHDTDVDDLRFCLYAMTREEEQQIMKMNAFRILVIHVLWPLQDLFLEIAEKIWTFIDVPSFRLIVEFFMLLRTHESHFYYRKNFEAFWQRSPNHLREIVNECPRLKKRIDSFFNEMKSNNPVVTLPENIDK